jgi:hypothetical protein
MSLKTAAYKLYLFALIAGFAALVLHSIPKMAPNDRLFTIVVAALFLFFYFLAPAIFEAKVQPTGDGLQVEQWGRTFIAYREIKGCYSFYLFPWQEVILTTQRGFPLNILIAGDKLVGPRRSLTQDGHLALHVKSKMRPSANG